MKICLPDLETRESLKFASELGCLNINEPVTVVANMNWVRPFGMLFTAMALKQFRKRYSDIPFQLELSTGKGIDYAGHMGFFKTISPQILVGKLPGEASGNSNYIPMSELDITQIHRTEIESGNFIEIGDAVEKESQRLSQILSRGNQQIHILLTYLIREILRNIPEHAEVSKAWICGQFWNNDTAEIAIADEGIGVKSSLQTNRLHVSYASNDEDALRMSIKAGISQAFGPGKSNRSNEMWANSGFGLFMASEICKRLDGSFCIASGGKYLRADSDKGVIIGDTCFSGTAVKITISTSGLENSKAIISEMVTQGELQAKAIRNAFRNASTPSKWLVHGI